MTTATLTSTSIDIGALRYRIFSICLFCTVVASLTISLVFLSIKLLQISVGMLLDGHFASALTMMGLTILAAVLFGAIASERASACIRCCEKMTRFLLGMPKPA